MSSVESNGKATSLYPWGNELTEQFGEVLGDSLAADRLVKKFLSTPSLNSSRSTIKSFIPDVSVSEALRAVYSDVDVSVTLEPDEEDLSETATYKFEAYDENEEYKNRANFIFSPNAVKTIVRPLSKIVSDMSSCPAEEANTIKFASCEVALDGLFGNVAAQLMVKQHLFVSGQVSRDCVEDSVRYKIDAFYEKKFSGTNLMEAEDLPLRLNRLAMCLGGAVMYRQVTRGAEKLVEDVSRGSGVSIVGSASDIASSLKMYGYGLNQMEPLDDKEAAFPLAHAFSPQEAAQFMRSWF